MLLRRRAACRTRSDGCIANLGKREALAPNRRNSARFALYLAPLRLHSEPHMATTPLQNDVKCREAVIARPTAHAANLSRNPP